MIKTAKRNGLRLAKVNCKNKKKHTEYGAKQAKKIMEYKGKKVNIYHCKECGNYHTTKCSLKEMERRSDFYDESALIGTKNSPFIVRLFRELEIPIMAPKA
ncbi:hypothetical protein KAR91_12895 [Candidatus Pacearchaeota archaeon]|nr:hypothetical protein [Candidatus Pacearchaeota archaeon]